MVEDAFYAIRKPCWPHATNEWCASVAIQGTACALVAITEMGYKVLTSRPSRFVGRTLLSGLKKLDDKLMSESTKK